MVVLILALTLTWGLPSLQRHVAAQRVAAAARAFSASLQLARTEARVRAPAQQVSVIMAQPEQSWAGGWSVQALALGPHAGPAPLRAELLEHVSAWPGIHASQTGRQPVLTFHGLQRGITDAGRALAPRSVWFDAPGTDRYCLVLNAVGRVRTARVSPEGACHDD